MTIAVIDTHAVIWYLFDDVRLSAPAKETDVTMNPKSRPNHKHYLQALRNMSPEQRLLKAFELSRFTRQLFIQGLRKRFPNATEEEFKHILLKRLAKCHNRNY